MLVEKFLSTKEAAKILNCSQRQITRECLSGNIRGAWRSNGDCGRWKIPLSGIQDFVCSRGGHLDGEFGNLSTDDPYVPVYLNSHEKEAD